MSHLFKIWMFGEPGETSADVSISSQIDCQDESYLTKEEVESLHEELFTFLRLLNGYIRSIGTADHQ